MPLGWIDTASESDGEIPQSASWDTSTFPKEIDFTGTTQEIYNSLMEGILTNPHARKSTMPMERQQTIVFNQPTTSTKTWDDATDDETSPWINKPDEQLSPGEIAEAVQLDSIFPIQRCTSPTLSTTSEESGSTDTVGHPTIQPRNPMLHQRVYKLTNSTGSKPKLGNYLAVYLLLNVHNNPSILQNRR